MKKIAYLLIAASLVSTLAPTIASARDKGLRSLSYDLNFFEPVHLTPVDNATYLHQMDVLQQLIEDSLRDMNLQHLDHKYKEPIEKYNVTELKNDVETLKKSRAEFERQLNKKGEIKSAQDYFRQHSMVFPYNIGGINKWTHNIEFLAQGAWHGAHIWIPGGDTAVGYEYFKLDCMTYPEAYIQKGGSGCDSISK